MYNIKKNFLEFNSNYFSVAPMLNWTDRHCRYFHRQLTKFSMLYTEMINTKTLINSKNNYLHYNAEENLTSVQLGGSNPKELIKCAKLIEKQGYKEINFNVGCPSKRAQSGNFGVCLMNNSNLVVECIESMSNAVNIPITIKTRIGVDNHNNYDFLHNFVEVVSAKGGCKTFIIHARPALLSIKKTKNNLIIPQLNYLYVYQIKRDFPNLTIILNGGIKSLIEAKLHLKHVDGVMIGREAYKNPNLLAEVDSKLFNVNLPIINRIVIVRSMYSYIEKELKNGTNLYLITRHMLGLFKGIPGANKWRRFLSEKSCKNNSNINTLEKALSFIHKK